MKKWTKKQLQTINTFRFYSLVAGFGFMAIVFLLGLLFFFRPATSEVEKRDLTKFPKLTMATFLDGSYFSDISLWYSDTFPLRDQFIYLNNNFKHLYGIESESMMIGGNTMADDIPTERDESNKDQLTEEATVPEYTNMDEAVQNQIFAGLYIENGAAYGGYYFSQSAADIYIDAMNQLATDLDGVTNVYSLLIPNNSGAILDDETLKKLGGSDQGQAIKYYFNSYNDKVIPIPIYDTLRKHRDEYLYFRTDHHWNQNGAYYAYKSFCKVKGIKAKELSEYETMEFYPFLGSYYTQLQLEELTTKPDKVTAYIPSSTNDMIYNDGQNDIEWKIIMDVSDWDQSSGYYCYVAGDKPFAVMDNPEINDGSSVLVIKESYGNCFIPFLVDHYDKVYYMDFRYTPYNVTQFCKENKVTDLIIENNIQIIGSDDVALTIKGLF